MGVSINGSTQKWMVYKGKSENKMDDDWGYGTPILGQLHIAHVVRSHFIPNAHDCLTVVQVQLNLLVACISLGCSFKHLMPSWMMQRLVSDVFVPAEKPPVGLDGDYGPVFALIFLVLDSAADVFLRLETRCLKPFETIGCRSTQALAKILSFSARKRSTSSSSWAYLGKSNSGASMAQNLRG